MMLLMLLLLLNLMGMFPTAPARAAPLAEVIPVAETDREITVWWRNADGSIIERRADGNADCRLHLSAADSEMTFYWVRGQPAHMTVTHQGWDFIPEAFSLSAMRIGAVWLGGNDAASGKIMTLLHGDSATMMLTDAIDTLLLSADQITIRLEDETLSIPLTRSRMQPLVNGLRKCLKSIG